MTQIYQITQNFLPCLNVHLCLSSFAAGLKPAYPLNSQLISFVLKNLCKDTALFINMQTVLLFEKEFVILRARKE